MNQGYAISLQLNILNQWEARDVKRVYPVAGNHASATLPSRGYRARPASTDRHGNLRERLHPVQRRNMRSFNLGGDVQETDIKASFKDGVLKYPLRGPGNFASGS